MQSTAGITTASRRNSTLLNGAFETTWRAAWNFKSYLNFVLEFCAS